jgi:hypothetical protein
MGNSLKPYRKTKKDARMLNKTAQKLIDLAKAGGCEQNYFFQTTFERYQEQLRIMERLQEIIDSTEDLMVDNARGTGLVPHPAISEYNKTATAANQTAQTLIKVILTFSDGQVMNSGNEEEDLDL